MYQYLVMQYITSLFLVGSSLSMVSHLIKKSAWEMGSSLPLLHCFPSGNIMFSLSIMDTFLLLSNLGSEKVEAR